MGSTPTTPTKQSEVMVGHGNKNDITGDSIQSRVSSNAYKDNYDAIFGKKKVIQVSEEVFDNFSEMLEDTQEPNKALSELMSRPNRWVENEKEESNDQAV